MQRLHIVNHSLVGHKLSLLRDKRTDPRDFRELLREITLILTVEATRDLSTKPTRVETPLAIADGSLLAGEPPVAVPILRAGLAMVEAFLALVPSASIGHVGLYRDPESHEPVEYYAKMPPDLSERPSQNVDPMLATGGSAVAAIDFIKAAGGSSIVLLSVIAAPEGVEKVHEVHKDVSIYLAALDERLDERAYIVPGLGDAGDRLFGTQDNRSPG
ncbi:MAG: uracil phosphoribosyltransferase [Chloroflexi bacterium]|nr:uracil phosphoribosyltransferase [Chloroflexota bacterium]